MLFSWVDSLMIHSPCRPFFFLKMKLELIARFEKDSTEAEMKLNGAKKSLANGTKVQGKFH
jgi:hypothetical protein